VLLLLSIACAPAPPDIVLVSLDTTRADALDAETTPNLWKLASTGVRFEMALAHAPTTLSSHASVMTGLDPHGTAVVRNGFGLSAEHPVLAEKLAAAGFDTIGVIGASALAKPMGIDRGFHTWDERFSIRLTKRNEARAEEVTDRALGRLQKRKRGARVFLFAHFYDAHGPYDAPPPWTQRWSDPAYHGPFDGTALAMKALADASRDGTADPADVAEARARYRGEVSYVDAQVGRLLAKLDHPIVVVFGDHGEALGDVAERPWGHGPDVDLPATHVPLIVAGPGIPARVVSEPVALSDVAATVLSLAGIPGGLGEGRDLSVTWNGGTLAPRPLFLEATQPHEAERTDGWNNLAMERGVARGDWMLVRTPWLGAGPDLLSLVGVRGVLAAAPTAAPGSATPNAAGPTADAPAADPSAAPAGLADELDGLLTTWDAAAPPWRPEHMDAETKAGLKALGYTE
jgi:arylsulfatase A-like enzyme